MGGGYLRIIYGVNNSMDTTFFSYLPIFLSLLLSSAVGLYAWRYRQSPGIYQFILVTVAEIFWVFGYLFELANPDIKWKLFWDDFQFIGLLFMALFLMFFAYDYTGQEKHLPRRTRMVLTSIILAFLFLLYTNPLHGLVRETAWIVAGEPFDILFYDYTMPMWVIFIYAYLIYITATLLFIRNLFRQHRLFRRQTLIIIIGFIFPFIGSFSGLLGLTFLGQRDIMPYTFGVANLVFAWGLFRYSLFDVTPIARDAVMEYMNDVIIVLDAHSRVVDVNRATLSGLETTVDQVIGLPISQMLAGRPDLIQLFERNESFRENVSFTSPSGREFILNSYISPLRDQSNKVIGRLLVARDITGQRQAEAELQKSHDELEIRVQQRTAELEKANYELEQKNAELERFTYTVSHDLKTPLVTISGYLGYLKDDITTGNLDRLDKDMQRIAGAVDKMHNLLTDLLELSRIGRMVNPSEVIPFQDLVDDTLELVHGILEAGGVTVQTTPNLPPVYGDKPRLIEVLQNLLENAVKFMGDQPEPTIMIGTDGEEDGDLIFFVRDNGMGIAPEYHDRVFGLFNRLNPDTEGTGIGLTLIKRIVEFHGGRIWLESELGKGSTFYFTLQKADKS